MPIEQLSDQRRLTRDFKIRLGGRLIKVGEREYREPKYDKKTRQREEGGFPKETDHFVLLPEEVPEDVIAGYGPEPKRLRMMLPMEWDALDPKTGDELVFNRYNRAYGRTHGLKCKGTGNNAEFPGMASTTDQAWAVRIAQASELAFETVKLPSGTQYRVRCLGQDCPKYLRMVTEEYDKDGQKRTRMVKGEGVDPDAACKRVFILRAFLLHHTTDPKSENYCRVLGLAEIASSSYHTMINLQSDFPMMRAFTNGQTAGIPFTLVRTPITTFKPSRQIHNVLKVSLDYQEVQRWATIAMQERFMNDEMRARQRQIAASPLAPSWDSVKDLVPQGLLEAPVQTGPEVPEGSPEPAQGSADGPQVTEGGTDRDRPLVKGEITELKHLAGGRVNPDGPEDDRANPWKPTSLAMLKEVIALYNAKHGTAIASFTGLTWDAYLWIKEYLAGVGSTARTTVIDAEPQVRGADPTVRHPEGPEEVDDEAIERELGLAEDDD